MTAFIPLDRVPLALLTDEVVELRLLRIMGPDVVRPVGQQFLADVPEVRYAIHRQTDGLRVGRIHIRITNEIGIVQSVGHTGYAVDEAYRCQGYATHAIRLIVGLARHWQVVPLWVLIEPDNLASRRAAERAGLSLVDVVNSTAEAMSLGVGSAVCRYRAAG